VRLKQVLKDTYNSFNAAIERWAGLGLGDKVEGSGMRVSFADHTDEGACLQANSLLSATLHSTVAD
jgi:hypothetical protein